MRVVPAPGLARAPAAFQLSLTSTEHVAELKENSALLDLRPGGSGEASYRVAVPAAGWKRRQTRASGTGTSQSNSALPDPRSGGAGSSEASYRVAVP